jgi:hypothetical protein
MVSGNSYTGYTQGSTSPNDYGSGSFTWIDRPSGVILWNECGNGAELDWNAVTGATSYNIEGIVNGQQVNYTTTTNSTYGLNISLNGSYTVQAVAADGSTGLGSSWTSGWSWDGGAC